MKCMALSVTKLKFKKEKNQQRHLMINEVTHSAPYPCPKSNQPVRTKYIDSEEYCSVTK